MTPRELGPEETGLAFGAMQALRTALVDVDAFVRDVNETQRPQGYRLAGSFDGDQVVAVAGFRILHMLAFGRLLYVDDLSTLPHARGRGHGRRLLDWLLAEAREYQCQQLHLDSGVQAERADAHRLYMNFGMRITSHHFARNVM